MRLTLVDCGHTGLIHWHAATRSCEILHGDNLPLGTREVRSTTSSRRPFRPATSCCCSPTASRSRATATGSSSAPTASLNACKQQRARAPRGGRGRPQGGDRLLRVGLAHGRLDLRGDPGGRARASARAVGPRDAQRPSRPRPGAPVGAGRLRWPAGPAARRRHHRQAGAGGHRGVQQHHEARLSRANRPADSPGDRGLPRRRVASPAPPRRSVRPVEGSAARARWLARLRFRGVPHHPERR